MPRAEPALIAEETIREAVFSPCGKFRYTLWRHLPGSLGLDGNGKDHRAYVQFIGLNPSTADNINNDRTINKLIMFAGRWGYHWMLMTNLFAYRTKDPKIMKAHPGAKSPIGIDNFRYVVNHARKADLVVCCWGNGGAHLHQAGVMRAALAAANVKLKCFRVTSTGEPEHPLYLKNSIDMIDY
jgi:hypothetical protein